MPELSLQHIDRISQDISREEIIFSHLLEDLIDHVCCDVENEMQNGLNFQEAYKKVKNRMGSRRLKEIQEETLYAVDTKYRYMKNTMKISGVAGTILFGFAAMFKIQHWPGAGILITLGAFVLAFLFLPSALVVLWKESHNRKRLFLFISAFLTGIFFIAGILFKIQHWPGAGKALMLATLSGTLLFIPSLLASRLRDQEMKAKKVVYILGSVGIILYVVGMLSKIQHWSPAVFLMVSGGVILSIVVFPWYTWLTWKDDNHVSASFIFMVIGYLAITVPGAMIALNLQNSFDKGYYFHQEQQQALYNSLFSRNMSIMNQYHDSSEYQLMEKLHSKTTGLLTLIGDIQSKMVAESEGIPGIPAVNPIQISQTEKGPMIQYNLLLKPFDSAPFIDFLLPRCAPRQELNIALKDYSDYLSDLTSGELLQRCKGLLDPFVFIPEKGNNGTSVSMMSALHSLELLRNSILIVESLMLTSLVSN
jgi:hypothetical protein